MKTLHFFLSFLFFSILPLYGQDELDSLKLIANNKEINDSTRIVAIATIIDFTVPSKERQEYTNLLGELSRKNYKKQIISKEAREFFTSYLAVYYTNLSSDYNITEYQKSIGYLDKAIELFTSIDNMSGVYFCKTNQGIIYSKVGRYKEAIDIYFEALRYFEKQDDYDYTSYIYSNLGVLYDEQKEYKKSINYYQKSLQLLEKKQQLAGYTPNMEDEIQTCELYLNIGGAYQRMNDYSSAEIYFNKAIAKTDYPHYVSFAHSKLGVLKLDQNKNDEARIYLEKAYELSEEGLSRAFSSIYLGQVLHLFKENKKALNYAEEGLNEAKAIERLELIQDAYELLFQINKEEGNYEVSLNYLEQYYTIKDSLDNDEAYYLLKNKELEYDYEKKELALKLKTEKKNARKNYLLFGLGALLLILVIVTYFLYRSYKQKQKIADYEKRNLNQKLLLSQMNPHFIFNSVDTIQSLIHLNQTEDAIFYLNKFARLTRQVLENSGENYIEFSEELAMIENYLTIQRLLYNNGFEFKIEVSEELEIDNLFVPPMLVQPFVENAIKHGVSTIENGMIHICFKGTKKQLIVEIQDNGKGLQEKEMMKKHQSLSVKMTKERLMLLSGSEDILIHFENKHPGTKVWFEIPHLYEV